MSPEQTPEALEGWLDSRQLLAALLLELLLLVLLVLLLVELLAVAGEGRMPPVPEGSGPQCLPEPSCRRRSPSWPGFALRTPPPAQRSSCGSGKASATTGPSKVRLTWRVRGWSRLTG